MVAVLVALKKPPMGPSSETRFPTRQRGVSKLGIQVPETPARRPASGRFWGMKFGQRWCQIEALKKAEYREIR